LAIQKLIELTQDGNLNWEIVSSSQYLADEDTYNAVYFLEYEKSIFLLYKKAYMKPNTQFSASLIELNSEKKDYRPNLCIYNKDYRVTTYTFQYSQLINDLYRAVSYYAGDVEKVISKILGDTTE